MAVDTEKTVDNENIGEIRIAEEVVLTVAGLAVGEVKGVTVAGTVTDGIVEKFVKKNYGKGVRVEMNEEKQEVSVDVHVIVDYGLKIPEIAWELQETVKKNIETMTNMTASKVNIFVEGIHIEKEPKPAEKKKEARASSKQEMKKSENESEADKKEKDKKSDDSKAGQEASDKKSGKEPIEIQKAE